MPHTKLRGRIAEKFKNSFQFWKQNKDTLGCTYPTITQKLNGAYSFTIDDIKVWMKLLEISPSEIYEYFFD